MENTRIVSIIGAGSWGTTIAHVIAVNHGNTGVSVWAYEKSIVSSINETNENRQYLPGVSLPRNVRATGSLKECLRNSSVIIIATPSKAVYETCVRMRKYVNPESHVAFVSKGFCKVRNEIHTISETIAMAIPQVTKRIVAISGPSHAEEVSAGFHTCLCVAGSDGESREVFVRLLSCGHLQCRETDDIRGVELGGTLKNPAAIAAGLISALPRCGDNLAGALMAESMKEILRIGKALGAREDTMIDISGLGDLITTAMSEHSRNRRFGRDIARKILDTGKSLNFYDRILLRFNPDHVLGRMSEKLHYLAEGAYAIEPLIELADRKNISIPVYRSLYEVLLNKKNPSLLIETVKNPDRFDDIYARTKINIIQKKKGMEHAGGYYFRKIIVRSVMAKFTTDEPFRKSVLAFAETVISGDRGRYPGDDRERKLYVKEIRLFRRMRHGDAEGLLKTLAGIYFADISDRYNYLAYNVFLRLLRVLSRLNIFGTGGFKRWFEQNIEAAGTLVDIRKAVETATPVYLAEHFTGIDSALIGMAINKAGLPAPRYFVDKKVPLTALMRGAVRRTGGYIVDGSRMENPLYRETLMRYLSETVSHGIPVLYFSGNSADKVSEPPAIDKKFLSMLVETLLRTTEEIAVLPVSVSREGGPAISGTGVKLTMSFAGLLSTRARIYFSLPLPVSDFTHEDDPATMLGNAVTSRWGSLL